MDTFISITTVVLIVAYVGVAIWLILCKSNTIGGAIGIAAGFLCGGFIIVPLAEVISAIVCPIIVAVLIVVFIIALFLCG